MYKSIIAYFIIIIYLTSRHEKNYNLFKKKQLPNKETRKRKIMKKSELIKNALIQIYSALDCIETKDDENNAIWTKKLICIKTTYRIDVTEYDIELIENYLSSSKFNLTVCL